MNKAFVYFSYFMGLFFMAAGGFIVKSPPPALAEPPYLRYVAGFVLVMYGAFRLVRARYSSRNNDR